MTVEIRSIAEDEVQAWMDAMRFGFLDHTIPGEGDFYRASIDLTRTIGAFDGGQIVATLRSFATELTVPGGHFLPASSLTNVTVAATHRRQGLLTRMLAADLAASVQRGEAASVLIASEYAIYGRFGYGPATEQVDLSVDALRARFARPTPGTVELVDAATLRAEAPAVFERHRARYPGSISWPLDRLWDIRTGVAVPPGDRRPAGRRALVREPGGGEVTGYLRYHIESAWEHRQPASTLVVDELIGATPVATARLWRYATEVDWVATVRADTRGPEEVLPWLLTDARAVRQTGRGDLLWVRILDAERALAARAYSMAGSVVLEVIDPLGYAAGRYVLEGGPDGARCTRTDAAAELVLSVDVLGAAYLGATPVHVLTAAGLIEERREGAMVTADRMFRSPVAPWCATWF